MSYFSMLSLALLISLFSFSVPAFAANPKIIFDQAHGQRFTIEQTGDLQLSELAKIFRSAGAEVVSSKIPITGESLKDASGLVISGAFEALKPEEIAAVVTFVEKGGRVAVMLHVAPPMADLLHRLGVDISNYVLHEQHNIVKDNNLNFSLKKLDSSDPLLKGINEFSAYGVWALNAPPPAVIIASTSSDAWLDLNGDGKLSKGDAIGSFAVVITGTKQAGRYVVFGDDAIFQNRFLDINNRKLARNVAGWLMRK